MIQVNVLETDVRELREYIKNNYPTGVIEYFDRFTKFVNEEISEEDIDFNKLYQRCNSYFNYGSAEEIRDEFIKNKNRARETRLRDKELGSIALKGLNSLMSYLYSGNEEKYKEWMEKRKEIINHENFRTVKLAINVNLVTDYSKNLNYEQSGSIVYKDYKTKIE